VGTPVIGLVEGIAEGTASLLKVASGWLSDRLGHRKRLALLGYGLSTLAKPFLYFASSWGAVAGVRFVDRVGKGIRTSPRDALVADSSGLGELGKSFGFHRGMDTFGAVLGLALAALIVFLVQQGGLELTRNAFRWLVIVGTVPAVMALIVLAVYVREQRWPGGAGGTEKKGAGFSEAAAGGVFDRRFKVFLLIVVVFTLGNSSDAFLILRAQDLGFSVVGILLLLVAFNLVYALASVPAGVVSDRMGRRRVILAGWSIYAITYLGLAVAAQAWSVWVLFALYGLYYGIAEGVTRAYVADLVPVERRGTAYGLYHMAVGLSLLPASVIAGWLWQLIGPEAPFYFGSGMAAAAMVGLLVFLRR
jgi:MFS family permease